MSPVRSDDVDSRIARTRDAVLVAASRLLVDGGPSALTVDAVVAESGVAKTTIYRHWTSRDELLVDVMRNLVPVIEPPDPQLRFEAALRAFVASVVDLFADPEWRRVLPALLMLKNHEPAVADIQDEFRQRELDTLGVVIERGVAEGVIAPGRDLDVDAALLIGPVLFALVDDGSAVDDTLADAVVDGFLAARRIDR